MMIKTPKERSRVQSQCLEGPQDSLCRREGTAQAQHSDTPFSMLDATLALAPEVHPEFK